MQQIDEFEQEVVSTARLIEYQILRLIIGIALAISIGDSFFVQASAHQNTQTAHGLTVMLSAIIGIVGAWLIEIILFTGLVEHYRYILPLISSFFRVIEAIVLYQLIFFIGGLMLSLNLLTSIISGSDAESIRFPVGQFLSNATEMDSFLKNEHERDMGIVSYLLSLFIIGLIGAVYLLFIAHLSGILIAHLSGILILLSQLMTFVGLASWCNYLDKQKKLKRRARKRKLAKKR